MSVRRLKVVNGMLQEYQYGLWRYVYDGSIINGSPLPKQDGIYDWQEKRGFRLIELLEPAVAEPTTAPPKKKRGRPPKEAPAAVESFPADDLFKDENPPPELTELFPSIEDTETVEVI